MKFTLNWLKRHLHTDADLGSIVSKLNEIGLEVEEVCDNGKAYETFLVAEILEVIEHPNASRLKICMVNDGTNVLQIVCGAANARAGIKVVLAPVGTIIPLNNTLIKKAEIRGVESFGMLCSAQELKLDVGGEDGIMELELDAVVGDKFAKYANLNEIIFEIGLTPNRGDCASVFGIARDLSATKIGKLIEVNNRVEVEFKEDETRLVIDDKENCSEFCITSISGVNNFGDLADKNLASYLQGIKYQTKNPLVDLSNFFMFDLGRPNHMYDADKIKWPIRVRKSLLGEAFQALGGNKYELPAGITVVADAEKVLSIAGVIGGELSKVEPSSVNILIEVANFHPHAIIKAGRALNIITDSRFRFERGVDSANTRSFANALTDAVLQNCGGTVLKTIKCAWKQPDYLKSMVFDSDIVEKVSGHKISKEQIQDILEGLGFEWHSGGTELKIPSWRWRDIESPHDIVEEVLRIYGLSNIPMTEMPITFAEIKFHNSINEKLGTLMAIRSMNECISWSFCSESNAQLFSSAQDLLCISNPISHEMSTMRPSVLASFLPIIAKNIERGIDNLGIFEIGNIYSNKYKFRQTSTMTGIRSGLMVEKNIHSKERLVDFFDVKDDVFYALQALGLESEDIKLTIELPDYYHPKKGACFKLGRDVIAFCGELHPKITQSLKSKALFGFEIFLDNIPRLQKRKKIREIISDFQPVSRDFAFILKKEIEVGEIIKNIKSLNIDEIEKIKVFDIYEGVGVQDGCKSVAIKVLLQPKIKTFTDTEIENISDRIVSVVHKNLDGVLRQ